MSRKKLAPIRDKPIGEIEAEIIQLQSELSKEKASVASGTRAEKPSKIRNARRKIARLLTIINEKRKEVSKK
jgi:ribosomal protein L29